jgi:hypothetical protein
VAVSASDAVEFSVTVLLSTHNVIVSVLQGPHSFPLSSFVGYTKLDRPFGLVVRVDTDPEIPGSIPGPTRFTEKWSGTGSTQPREYN